MFELRILDKFLEDSSAFRREKEGEASMFGVGEKAPHSAWEISALRLVKHPDDTGDLNLGLLCNM